MPNCLDLKEEIGFERGQKKHEAQTLKDSPVSILRCQKGNRGLGVDLLYPLILFWKQRPTLKPTMYRRIGRLKECISDDEAKVTHLFNIVELETEVEGVQHGSWLVHLQLKEEKCLFIWYYLPVSWYKWLLSLRVFWFVFIQIIVIELTALMSAH